MRVNVAKEKRTPKNEIGFTGHPPSCCIASRYSGRLLTMIDCKYFSSSYADHVSSLFKFHYCPISYHSLDFNNLFLNQDNGRYHPDEYDLGLICNQLTFIRDGRKEGKHDVVKRALELWTHSMKFPKTSLTKKNITNWQLMST